MMCFKVLEADLDRRRPLIRCALVVTQVNALRLKHGRDRSLDSGYSPPLMGIVRFAHATRSVEISFKYLAPALNTCLTPHSASAELSPPGVEPGAWLS